ncbi:hypothetical protein ACHBTE_03095 [Streptomyces sp. M41]|uniref:hypothetical protein n=1 Tax=Streptomyces sp. M41 TaxID=3059412 RepID=UPI00374DC52A
MNTVMSAAARAHAVGREATVRQTHRQLLFRRHPDSRLHLTRLDPAHALLRTHFPHSWQRLLHARALLDAVAVLDLPPAVRTDQQHLEQIAPLLRSAAQELDRCAVAERNQSARLAAERLSAYVSSGRWPSGATASDLDTTQPWVYVGPAPAAAGLADEEPYAPEPRTALCLLVAAPETGLQSEVDAASVLLDDLRRAAGGILGGDAATHLDRQLPVAVADLLLAGGVPHSGHWDLCPLQPPYPVALFANVRRHRLRAVAPERTDEQRESALGRSLRRSVGHVAAHHWRRASLAGAGAAAPGLKSFERLAFEEAYALLLSLMAATATGAAGPMDPTDLMVEFLEEVSAHAELPDQHTADTAAALVVLGRLRQGHSAWGRPPAREAVAAARPALEELVRLVHAALWEADSFALAAVRAAYAAGVQHQARSALPAAQPPVEFGWTFG